MDAQIKSLQRIPPSADQQQRQSISELLDLKESDMPLPPHFYVAQGLTALRTQEGIMGLQLINPYINVLNANMTAAKLVEQGADSFIVMNQTFQAIKNNSKEELLDTTIELMNKLKVPVLLYMGGAIHIINRETTVAQLFIDAKEPSQLLDRAKDYRIEQLKEIRNNLRLQQYLSSDFGISSNLLEQLLALPNVHEIGITNCPIGANIEFFAEDLKNQAKSEGMPICFTANFGAATYLLVINSDTKIKELFDKLNQYTVEARERSERLLNKALEEFLVYNESLRNPEDMLEWLQRFKQSDFYIHDQQTRDSFEIRCAALGYEVGQDEFISSRWFDPEMYNAITDYLLNKSEDEVDKLIIASCLNEIIESGSLTFSIGIPRRSAIQAELDKIN
jgi:hypothetical protein